MKRKTWIYLATVLMVGITVALLLGVAGCGGRTQAPEAGENAAIGETVEVPAPEAPPATVSDVSPVATETPSEQVEASAPEAPPEPEVATAPATPAEGEPTTVEPLLSWERQDGPEDRCDRMSIYPDGRVVAVRCTSGVDAGTVETTLTEEQEAQLNAWADRFSSFSRRESDVTRAVMRTVLTGRGDVVPSTEEKTAVARFARELFLSLTPSP